MRSLVHGYKRIYIVRIYDEVYQDWLNMGRHRGGIINKYEEGIETSWMTAVVMPMVSRKN